MENQVVKKKLFNRNFILMLQGNGFSIFGDILYSIAISFWVYDKTKSTSLMGVVGSISMFVSMVVTPFAGAVVDRSSRKFIIVGTDFLRAMVMFVVAYFAYQEKLSVGMVLVVAFVAALCQVFFSPAVMTVFTDIIPEHEFMRGQSVSQGLSSLLSLIGKALSGVLITTFGLPLMIFANGISFLLSAISELFIDIPRNVKEGSGLHLKQILLDVKEGAKITFQDANLRIIIPFAILVNFLGAGMSSLYLPLILNKGFSLDQYGYMMSIFSLSGILGMVVMSSLKFSMKQRHLLMGYGFLGGMVFEIVGFLSNNYLIVMGSFFFGTFLMVMANAVINATLILAIPKEQRGLIIGFVVAASTGGSALSSLVYGFLAEFIALNLVGSAGSLLAMIPTIVFARNKIIKSLFIQEIAVVEAT